ncbi:MAG: recombinase family protein [Deltaproteobacteria bacterium]|nr:MAG: recombinase family protein [Deltaproteobacteria bacterium]
MKSTVAYFRVSTQEQSVDMQRRDIRSYCEALGISLVQEYTDEGVSGAKASRPGLDSLLSDVRRGKVNTVIVWSLSRLGRSLKNLLGIVEELEACGVSLVSIKEGWDLATPSGRMIFQVLGALSEWEREQIRERVRSGLRAAKARGRRLGRPTVSYDKERIIELKRMGLSTRSIAKELGVSNATISRVLQNHQILTSVSA